VDARVVLDSIDHLVLAKCKEPIDAAQCHYHRKMTPKTKQTIDSHAAETPTVITLLTDEEFQQAMALEYLLFC
jgi:hypothetical protein